MFDKMIISEAEGSASHGRSRYFLVSGLTIAALFLSAVVLSIYAIDLDLGTDEFDLSMITAPVSAEAPEPPRVEEPRSRPQAAVSNEPVRNANILRPEESPSDVPPAISVDKPTSLARPYGNFRIVPGALETNVGSSAPGGVAAGRGGDGTPSGYTSAAGSPPETAAVKLPEPPPALAPKPKGPISLGVVNGKAIHLPRPIYSAAAKAVNAQGKVTVQVTIDESGKVVSARAVDGHPILKREAEKAALDARFSPTLLSKVPVKVTGVIVYNFTKG